MSEHPTAGRRRKHKSPPILYLDPPSLLDHLREDDDGATCSGEEKEVKRVRSAPTIPRSVRGADPDDNDRVTGVFLNGFSRSG